MSKHYKANPEVAAICEEIIAAEADIIKKGCNLSRKHGGSRSKVITVRDVWGDLRVVGFHFKNEPDAKLFKRLKHSKGWAPRRSCKAGKELAKQLDALRCMVFAKLTKALKMNVFRSVYIRRPGIQKIGGDWYVHVPNDVNPPGLTRVSDVEMEALAA